MKPFMSVIVISYNMNRELQRTLYSLSAEYQRDITRDEYEVILVDNGSEIPPKPEDFSHLDIDLTIHHFENPTPSPVAAINMALNKAAGQFIGVCIDGARIHSPRVLATAREGLLLSDRTVVAVRGRYLGDKLQREAIAEGYNKEVEDALLTASHWETDGYRLFDVSVFDESSGPTWASPIVESNALFMGRSIWREINGFDPLFDSPGGGLVNLDTWKRVVELPNVNPLILAGEATFHQVHGGVATNGHNDVIHGFFYQYEQIRGHEFVNPNADFLIFGQFHRGANFTEGLTKSSHINKTARAKGQKLLVRKLRIAFSKSVGRKMSPTSRRILRGIFDRLAAVAQRNPGQGIQHFRTERDHASFLEAHPLFDSEWYAMTYPHVVAAGYEPSRHYVRFGVSHGTLPGPIFDAKWYLNYYADVRDSGLNPLLHYLMFGEKEGRRVRLGPEALGSYERSNEKELQQFIKMSSLFDSQWYVTEYPDVLTSGLTPEVHYLRFGTVLRKNPSRHFDGVRYRREHLDVLKSGFNPLVHYEVSGKYEGRSFHPVSD
jgi:glycosyltransferase involved in cell wall biosynthesis